MGGSTEEKGASSCRDARVEETLGSQAGTAGMHCSVPSTGPASRKRHVQQMHPESLLHSPHKVHGEGGGATSKMSSRSRLGHFAPPSPPSPPMQIGAAPLHETDDVVAAAKRQARAIKARRNGTAPPSSSLDPSSSSLDSADWVTVEARRWRNIRVAVAVKGVYDARARRMEKQRR